MTTWTARAFSQGLATLAAFAESSPEEDRQARDDFPEDWDPHRFPWLDASLLAWRLHGREDAEGLTAAARRLRQQGKHLSRAERLMLQALADSWCSVFEILEVRLNQGLRLRDLLLDEVLEVRERSLTTQVEPGDVMLTWAMPVEDHLELTGGTVPVLPSHLRPLLDVARRELGTRPPSAEPSERRRRLRRLAPLLFRERMALSEGPPLPSSLEELLDTLPEELLEAPRRRAFQDAALKRPRKTSRSNAELEPGAAYVFKLGPIDTRQDGRFSFYMGVPAEGPIPPPATAKRDAEGVAAVARELKGLTLYGESRLARAGQGVGLVARPMPASVSSIRAALALHLHWGAMAPKNIPPEAIHALLMAITGLIRAAPWDLWNNEEVFPLSLSGALQGTREVSVLGGGGQEVGFVVFDRAGAMERMAGLVDLPSHVDKLIPDSLGLTLEDEPAWVAKCVQDVTGLAFVPDLLRMHRNAPRPATSEEVLLTTAVALALAKARPEEKDVELLEQGARVHAEIPLPLLTGHYVGKVPLEDVVEAIPLRLGKVKKKLPPGKVSETLLDFAKGLTEQVHFSPDPQEELFTILALALSAWNAVVQDTWEPHKGWVERARATLRRLPEADREPMTRDFEMLVARKRRHFADDPRLLTRLDVVVRRGGELGVQVVGLLAPGAWSEYLGAGP
ncbi:hypothetical protein LZ198_27060 [Myxococcus sp. K15C18031901]|uniref:hypothetical protein n=1 Tax=Myxococcus dinghuensis TaxID=2906761 RepID=UPI0020A7EC79|nr:hypothetical protein [Myxococcus dinghuensis]MCP3102539.1 hypothetical protein [Myxococcus dinghuensis]